MKRLAPPLKRTNHLLAMTHAINAAVQPVLDAATWVKVRRGGLLFRLVKQRTGIDMNRQTVPLGPVVGHTIGGLPVDGNGRCVVVVGSMVLGFTPLVMPRAPVFMVLQP